MLCQLDSAAFYLVVRSGIICPADAELNSRLRSAGVQERRGQGPVNRRRYSSCAETPFAYIDPNIRPADIPCSAQRRRSLKDCPRVR
jgi:hypothetical protein